MKPDTLYVHKKTLDVAFSPRHIEDLDIGIVCIGFWWKISKGLVPQLLAKDTITIHNSDIDQWEIYEE
jgi:hypothetical protein